MTKIFTLEFLVAVLFIIDVFLVLLLALFVKRVNRMGLATENKTEEGKPGDGSEQALDSVRKVTAMLDPLVREAQEAALSFEKQIREKRQLSKDLNDALDTRIISVNLLLTRAANLQKKLETQKTLLEKSPPPQNSFPHPPRETNVVDQQNQVIGLYSKGMDINTIAEQLLLPKGEVQLVIDLKKKFVAMEQGR